MEKFFSAIVPACITFGPLFMTRIAGTARPEAGNNVVFAGVFMLVAGLCIMHRKLAMQQKLIEKLTQSASAPRSPTRP